MGVKVTGLSQFTRVLKDYPAIAGRTADSVCRQEGRALCVALGASTMPGGFSDGLKGGAVKEFEDSIKSQVHRVFATKDEKARLIALVARRSPKLAAAYARAVREGNEAQQRRYLREAGVQVEALDPGVHQRARTGRAASVPKKQPPLAVVPANQLRRYQREKGPLAGLAKASWYAAARGIGGRVRRNLVDSATGKRRTEEIFPARLRKLARQFPGIGGARTSPGRVEVFSNIRYIREALPDTLLHAAVENARISFRRSLSESLAAVRRKGYRGAA